MASARRGYVDDMTQPMHSDQNDAAGVNPESDARGLEDERGADAAAAKSHSGPGEPGEANTDEPTASSPE
jgi:hypothetical protein